MFKRKFKIIVSRYHRRETSLQENGPSFKKEYNLSNLKNLFAYDRREMMNIRLMNKRRIKGYNRCRCRCRHRRAVASSRSFSSLTFLWVFYYTSSRFIFRSLLNLFYLVLSKNKHHVNAIHLLSFLSNLVFQLLYEFHIIVLLNGPRSTSHVQTNKYEA